MALTTDEAMTPLHKGLSEWWSEETEYVFQRIERWAAFARGYNRLRSERLSKGRLTMHEEQESRWSISSNKLIIDDPSWSPSFHTLKRSRRRSRQEEEVKINRYNDGVLGYRSNANLDSTCLETYRYDHSIYFKTIGDIRNGKKERTESDEDSKEERSIDGEEEVDEEEEEEDEEEEEEEEEGEEEEVDEEEQEDQKEDEENIEEATFVYNSVDDRFYLDNNDSSNDNLEFNRNAIGVWPIVDLAKLDLNRKIPDTVDRCKNEVDWSSSEANNNYVEIIESMKIDTKDEFRGGGSRTDQDGTKGILAFKMKRRPSRTVKRSTVCGDNNVLWPGILLNYTRNVDPMSPTSPHHHHYAGNVK